MPQILRPGRNVWRIERAGRAAVLIDGAAFFRAVREAFLRAQGSIFIVGWDIDSRTRLVGDDGKPKDGYPDRLAEFLTELVRSRPKLEVNLLLWDFSILYATQRELFPRLALQWATPERVEMRLDDKVPPACSQHQKIIVVDDALAFSGGFDLTIRRWDTSEHADENNLRVDPSGLGYRPFHDVQMMVDGDAARALSAIARERWQQVSGRQADIVQSGNDAWPASFVPDFTDVDIGIARTQPRTGDRDEVREAEALFFDAIDSAERTIYIENQFVTSVHIARRIARRLRQRPKLQVLVVAPRSYHSWLEARTMRNGRIRFRQILQEAGGDRVRLMYPAVAAASGETASHKATRGESATMVHSKVMIVDDRILRIGSANLNNRSMGADTECDLVVEGESSRTCAAIASIRNRLIADHSGTSVAEVAHASRGGKRLVEAADDLSGRSHRLQPIDDGEPDSEELSIYLEEIADPNRPPQLSRLWRKLSLRASVRTNGSALKLGSVGLVALGLTLAWYFSPLAQAVDLGRVQAILARGADDPLAIALVAATFVAGGLVAFPVMVLIAATGAAFGPWLGFVYATVGAIASALVTYAIGACFGQEHLPRLLGPRLERVRSAIERQGLLAVAAVRIVPVAPFTLVNLAAGASRIRLLDYIGGTLLGMLPGLVLLSALGHQIISILENPSSGAIALLVLALAIWFATIIGAQTLVSKLRGRLS